MKLRLAFLSLTIAFFCARPALAMTVQDLVALRDVGVSEERIVELFKSDGTVFRLTGSEIVLLEDAGLSHSLLREMILTQERDARTERTTGLIPETRRSVQRSASSSSSSAERYPGFQTYESPSGMKITPITPTLLTHSRPYGWWTINQPVLYTPSWAHSYPPYYSWGYPSPYWYGGGFWGSHGPYVRLPSHYRVYRGSSTGVRASYTKGNWGISLNSGLKVSYTDW